MTPDEQILTAMKRSEQYESIPLSVAVIEVLRFNESRGLTEAEMEVFAKRINDLCDALENPL